jgi:hypothetical protein
MVKHSRPKKSGNGIYYAIGVVLLLIALLYLYYYTNTFGYHYIPGKPLNHGGTDGSGCMLQNNSTGSTSYANGSIHYVNAGTVAPTGYRILCPA